MSQLYLWYIISFIWLVITFPSLESWYSVQQISYRLLKMQSLQVFPQQIMQLFQHVSLLEQQKKGFVWLLQQLEWFWCGVNMYLCFCTCSGDSWYVSWPGSNPLLGSLCPMGGSSLNFSPPGETSSSVSGLKSSLPASFRAVTSSPCSRAVFEISEMGLALSGVKGPFSIGSSEERSISISLSYLVSVSSTRQL